MRGGKIAKLALMSGVALGVLSGAALAQLAIKPAPREGAAAQGQPQGLGTNAESATYYGRMKATQTCPPLTWQVRRTAPGSNDLMGYFVFNDGQGASKATGTIKPDGTFHLTLANLDGKGPVGTIDGKQGRPPDRSLAAVVSLEGCPPLVIQPQVPYYAPQGNN
jgi:hypothetical protein